MMIEIYVKHTYTYVLYKYQETFANDWNPYK